MTESNRSLIDSVALMLHCPRGEDKCAECRKLAGKIVDIIIRQHTAVPETQHWVSVNPEHLTRHANGDKECAIVPSEIRYNEEELAILSTTLISVIADHAHNSQEPLRTKLCRHLRPLFATREPVTVDLSVGAEAIEKSLMNDKARLGTMHLPEAKAVAKAWGLKYVD